VSRKFCRKILGCAGLLIGCHSIPLWSDRDHDLVALLGTLQFECECLFFPVDVKLYDPSCNINRGSGGTQDGWMLSDTTQSWEAILEYQIVHRHKRIPDSHQDIFHGSHWKPDRLICQLQMHGSRDQRIMIQLIIDYLWHDAHDCSVIRQLDQTSRCQSD
jgi:hypothetical protein